MFKIKYIIPALIVFACTNLLAQTNYTVSHFDKIIVSPHIQVTFVEGDKESVNIINVMVSDDKINIAVSDKTLRVYLDGAKEVTKNEKVYENGHKVNRPIYKGTVVKAIITYKTLDELSLRGGETHVCESRLEGDEFRLKIYGESNVILNEVDLNQMHATIYGKSSLEIKSGSVNNQVYTAYGESKINSLGIHGINGKITVFGESDFQMNISDEIKLVAFGEAKLRYKGNPQINKGLHIGKVQIDKIQ